MIKSIYHFLRLIRTGNLLVIGLTMFVVEMFILKIPIVGIFMKQDFLSKYVIPMLEFNTAKMEVFWLLVTSTLLIAAAGNIINDYFDVKADRINKPNRLIIGKYIKRRWAMVLHWSFNCVGMLLALYVGYLQQNIWVPLIAFLSINLLWFYSAYYKRKPLIGNVMVALLIGIIPIYVLLLNTPLTDWSLHHTILEIYNDKVVVISFVSALAFLINLNRELVKDIQDVRGDLKLEAKTFPIQYGIRKSKYLISLFVLATLGVLVFFTFYALSKDVVIIPLPIHQYGNMYVQNTPMVYYFIGSILMVLIIVLIAWVLLLLANKAKIYKLTSTLLKFAMLFGLLTPLFL